ncbi:nitroreductase [Aurantimonas sp. VKM B-3413]|uniref:nitroreductase family protein n=1 Tax=Aurantimonas sp. VKM B-3413 TaxID=2779401 RepID=UPI002103E1D4|nr:nitroreductase [Aurantimonas sp. VKM B-3413]MCB8840133.1 nitroreductase [Aurantimonas sp. VKM B-3413]
MTDAITLLSTRRSIPIPMLAEPAPEGAELDEILTIAARVPDHGKLAPWRFILYRREAAARIGEALADLVARREAADATETRLRVERGRFTRAPLVVGVISRAGEHVKIPVWEQVLSGAAAAMNLVNAAHAKGYAANWVTEWVAYDEQAKAILSIAPEEKVIGFIHIGTPQEPPSDRPRPALADIVSEARGPGEAG